MTSGLQVWESGFPALQAEEAGLAQRLTAEKGTCLDRNHARPRKECVKSIRTKHKV